MLVIAVFLTLTEQRPKVVSLLLDDFLKAEFAEEEVHRKKITSGNSKRKNNVSETDLPKLLKPKKMIFCS